MSDKVNNIYKNCTYYFFNEIIYMKKFDFDWNRWKSYQDILIYYIEYVMIKDLKYVAVNSVNLLYLIFSKVNEYFEEINGNKYLTLVPTNEIK